MIKFEHNSFKVLRPEKDNIKIAVDWIKKAVVAEDQIWCTLRKSGFRLEQWACDVFDIQVVHKQLCVYKIKEKWPNLKTGTEVWIIIYVWYQSKYHKGLDHVSGYLLSSSFILAFNTKKKNRKSSN